MAETTTHYDSLTVPAKFSKTGKEIETYYPSIELLRLHMKERLYALFPDKISTDREDKQHTIMLDDGIQLHIDVTSPPNVRVGANGTYNGFSFKRFISGSPGPTQLVKELQAIQEHLPLIAEAHADFYRKQLPPSIIDVVYRSPASEGAEQDPVNPQRLAQLREELLVEPRDDDFKYLGGLDKEIQKLENAAMGFSHPEAFREFGVMPPKGILLQGPPGTGKTSLAMAFARNSESVLLSVKASTIKNAFHGETERNIRGVFQLADQLIAEGQRVVIFFDEIESFAPARNSFGASGIDKNVTTELLQGMNVDRENCIIIAATNDPSALDPALTGNGSRFSEQLEIDLPDATARKNIIGKLQLKFVDKSTGKKAEDLFDANIQIDTLANAAEGLSGADLENAIRMVLMSKAVMLAATGLRPSPASNGEIYQSIKNVAMAKGKNKKSYL